LTSYRFADIVIARQSNKNKAKLRMIDLDKRRRAAGMSIRQVAMAAGLGYATVYAIMRGQAVNPRIATYERILAAISKQTKGAVK
jgi:predicted transcriptional regulator